MQKAFEPEQRVAVGDGKVAHRLPVARAESLAESGLHLGVVIELVHDGVARDRRRAVPREGGQRLALPRSDAAGDGDGQRLRHRLRADFRLCEL